MAKLLKKVAVGSLGLGVVGYALAYEPPLYTVDGGERAIIWHRKHGVLDAVVGEGTHFRIPGITYPSIMDIRLRPRVISSRTGTKDLQQVQIGIRILLRPEEDHLPEIAVTLGDDWDERIIPSIANEVIKATVGQFDADQLLTQRDKVSKQIREALSERAKDFHIVLEDVSITHLLFSKEFTQAIEAKQVAQQEAERSKFLVMKAEQEQKAAIIRAEGESQAAEVISLALKTSGSGMIDVKRIDAAREIADILAKAPNVVYVPSGVNMLMPGPQPGRPLPSRSNDDNLN